MPTADSLLIWIHLVAASIWVGGSIFIGVVRAPILKSLANTEEEQTVLMIKIGRKFNRIAVPPLIVLVATGVYDAHTFIASPSTMLDSAYTNILAVKLALVSSMILTFGIHIGSPVGTLSGN